MKTVTISKFRTSLFAAVLAIAPLSPALHSQDVGMLAQVAVPFAFETATGNHFAAGIYTLRMENEHTLLIKGATNSGFTMVTVKDNAVAAVSGKAKFQRYGNRYFLSEISIAGHSRRIEFRPSKAEHELKVALGKTAPATVDVAVINPSR